MLPRLGERAGVRAVVGQTGLVPELPTRNVEEPSFNTSAADRVGRGTPCAPYPVSKNSNGAQGVARPTCAAVAMARLLFSVG